MQKSILDIIKKIEIHAMIFELLNLLCMETIHPFLQHKISYPQVLSHE